MTLPTARVRLKTPLPNTAQMSTCTCPCHPHLSSLESRLSQLESALTSRLAAAEERIAELESRNHVSVSPLSQSEPYIKTGIEKANEISVIGSAATVPSASAPLEQRKTQTFPDDESDEGETARLKAEALQLASLVSSSNKPKRIIEEDEYIYDSEEDDDKPLTKRPLENLSLCDAAVELVLEVYPYHMDLVELREKLEMATLWPRPGLPDALDALWTLILELRTPGALRMWTYWIDPRTRSKKRVLAIGDLEVPVEDAQRDGFVDYGLDGTEPQNEIYWS